MKVKSESDWKERKKSIETALLLALLCGVCAW